MKQTSSVFHKGAICLATALPIILSPAAHAQTSKSIANSSAFGVAAGECGAFTKYMTQEARDFGDKLSAVFLEGALRFLRAGCKPFDKDGEIQIITGSDQDGISLRTARRLMDRFDILKASGVKHCHRPLGGDCSLATGSAGGRSGVGG